MNQTTLRANTHDGVERVLRSIGTEPIRTTAKGFIQAACPLARWLHSSGTDNNASFAAKDDGSRYRCFSCKSMGTLEDLVVKYGALSGTNVSGLVSEVSQLEDAASIFLKIENEKTMTEFHEDYLRQFVFPEADDVIKCLTRRGINKELATLFEIRHDLRNDMVIFPLRSIDGALVGAQGRSISGKKKFHFYWADEGFELKYVLGGHQFLSDKPRLFLFESMFDMIKHWPTIQKLNGCGICTLTCDITYQQAAWLSWSDYQMVCCYDADKPGDQGYARLCDYFGTLANKVIRMRPPEGADFNDVPRDEFEFIFNRVLQ